MIDVQILHGPLKFEHLLNVFNLHRMAGVPALIFIK